MRFIALIFTVLFPLAAFASDVPDLLCSVDKTAIIPFSSSFGEEIRIFPENTIYRIKDDKLYVNDFEKQEYLYSDIKEIEALGRYTASYKTIIFNSDFDEAFVTHVSSSDVQASKWICKKSKD